MIVYAVDVGTTNIKVALYDERLRRLALTQAPVTYDREGARVEFNPLGKALIESGNRIAHVHLGDSNRLLPGRGLLNWHDIFGALNTLGYDGYVNLECSATGDPAVTLPATAASLRDLARR